jgi:nuclear transport factor 2 (NTF2) superfamily protein
LRSQLEEVGFTQVRIWYQTQNFNFRDADEYCACYCKTVTARNILSKVSEEKATEFKKDLKREYDNRMVKGVLDP